MDECKETLKTQTFKTDYVHPNITFLAHYRTETSSKVLNENLYSPLPLNYFSSQISLFLSFFVLSLCESAQKPDESNFGYLQSYCYLLFFDLKIQKALVIGKVNSFPLNVRGFNISFKIKRLKNQNIQVCSVSERKIT